MLNKPSTAPLPEQLRAERRKRTLMLSARFNEQHISFEQHQSRPWAQGNLLRTGLAVHQTIH